MPTPWVWSICWDLFPSGPLTGDVDWFREIGGRSGKVRVRTISRHGGRGFEDLPEIVECSRCDCFLMPANIDEVSAKNIVVHVVLDSRYDVTLQVHSGIVVDPAVLDDIHPFRRSVLRFKHPCPPTNRCPGANVVEEF